MSMATGFSWSDKTRRRSCHRRTDSPELDVFEAERYFSVASENLGHRSTTLSQKIGFATRDQNLGHVSTATRQNWRDVGRVSLDMPMMMRHSHTHTHTHHLRHTLTQPLDTLNPTKDKKKHKNPSSPGGKLASFFNSLISQAVSKKKKQSKSVKDLVEEESPSSGWRRRRRSSISHFRSSASSTAASFSAAFVSRKPDTPAPRAKRTSMSDVESKPCKHHNNIVSSAKVRNGGVNLDWLDEKFKMVKGLPEKRSSKGFERHVAGSEKRFVEEDGAESDSSSDLFELKLNYVYCGGGLPVYESTHMDSIKIS